MIPPNQYWCDELEKRTNGRLVVEPFWGGVLCSAQEMVDSVSSGFIEVTLCCPGYYPERLSLTGINYLPFLAPERTDHQNLVYDEYAKHPALIEEWARINAVYGFNQEAPPYVLMGNVPIRTVGT